MDPQTVAAVVVVSIVVILIIVLATRETDYATKQRKLLRIILTATGAVMTFALVMFMVYRLRLASGANLSAGLLPTRMHTFLAFVGMGLWTIALVFSLVGNADFEAVISPLIFVASTVLLLQAFMLIPKWGNPADALTQTPVPAAAHEAPTSGAPRDINAEREEVRAPNAAEELKMRRQEMRRQEYERLAGEMNRRMGRPAPSEAQINDLMNAVERVYPDPAH